MDLRHRTIPIHGISLHVVEAGLENGRPVFLLHGFPDFWYTWIRQIQFLADHGFRVVAPDQRGYNLSDKPAEIAAYNIDQLAADVIALMDFYNSPRSLLIGHDWGGSVAWRAAHLFPERVEKLVILNVPHSAVLKQALRSDFRQKLRSWYIFFFQVPQIPEFILSAFHCYLLKRLRARGGRLTAEETKLYAEAWSQPGAVHGMIQWYRALLQTKAARLESPRIKSAVHIIWGSRDKYLGREMAQRSLELCDHGELTFLENASHWVQHDEPDEVNRLILASITAD